MQAIPAPAVATMRARQNVLTGKILRVTSTGGIPPDNPFTGAGTGVCAVTGATTAGNHCQETLPGACAIRSASRPIRTLPAPVSI